MEIPKLDVGVIITAKSPCRMGAQIDALVVDKEYKILKLSNQSFWVASEVDNSHEFLLSSFHKFFKIDPQGAILDLSGVSDYATTLRVNRKGFTIDVENSDLAKGVIKYKKAEPKRPVCMQDLGECIEGFYLDGCNNIVRAEKSSNYDANHNVWPSREWAESVQAQCKLVRLRDAWNGDWKPDHLTPDGKATIRLFKNQVVVVEINHVNQLLCFSNYATAKAFLDTFIDLIETYFKPYKP